MTSKLLAVFTAVLNQRKAVASGRIRLRRVIIGMMTGVLLSLTGVGVASAQAQTQTFVSRTSFDEEGQFVCTTGFQQLTGQIQTVFHVTEDAAGGFTLVSNSNFVRFRGVDLLTGQRYQAVGSAIGNTITHVRGEFPATTTSVTPAHVIAQGPPHPGVTFELLLLVHVTVNANGETVVDRVELREECH
jgi:hypothetical protein